MGPCHLLVHHLHHMVYPVPMRRATITIPDELEDDLEAYLDAQAVRPSLAALAQRAIRQFVTGDEPAPGLIGKVLQQRAEIRAIAGSHGATSIALFGSVARGEARASSDLDFAVEVKPGTTLFDLARLRADLIELLGVDVDVIALNGLDAETRIKLEDEALAL